MFCLGINAQCHMVGIFIQRALHVNNRISILTVQNAYPFVYDEGPSLDKMSSADVPVLNFLSVSLHILYFCNPDHRLCIITFCTVEKTFWTFCIIHFY